MIRVVAIITAHPGRRDEVLAAFRANVPNVHAEKGCIEYAGHVDASTVGPFQTEFGPDSLSCSNPGKARRRSRITSGAAHEDLLAKDQGLVAKRTIHVLSATD